jgi:DNA-directed RNA polymerase subunit H (RpoH/RPB5)
MSNRVLQVYKSRKILLELLKEQQYNVTDYENFGINEVDAMCANSQLDMILQKENESHVYVNYFISGKKLSADVLDNLVEDLFEIEAVLKDKKKDHIILIVNEEPNQTMVDKLKYLYDKEGYFILVFNIARLQFNVLKHVLVPTATILEEVEEAALFLQYHLTSSANLPEISRFDPQAMAIGLRPGKIVKLERKSPTAMNYLYYRVCV